MPPHCDSLDGPVVTAARHALDHDDVDLVLPYVPAEAEAEVKNAYDRTTRARPQGAEAREIADLWFYETVVRLHRAGEGAPYSGLKPAGLEVGPVIPIAERAIRDEDPTPLIEALTEIVRDETLRRFHDMTERKQHATHDVATARRYVTAMLGLQVWAHQLAVAAQADPHADDREHHH